MYQILEEHQDITPYHEVTSKQSVFKIILVFLQSSFAVCCHRVRQVQTQVEFESFLANSGRVRVNNLDIIPTQEVRSKIGLQYE